MKVFFTNLLKLQTFYRLDLRVPETQNGREIAMNTWVVHGKG